MKSYGYLFLLILFDLVGVWFGVYEISISYNEAKIFYEESGFLHFIVNFIGKNELNLRLFFMSMHIASIILFFEISKHHLKYEKDALFSTLIFVLLPGVYSASVIIHNSGLLIFLILFFIYLHIKIKDKAFWLLPFYLFIDGSFNTLYFGLIFYAMYQKNNLLLLSSLILFTLSMYIFPMPHLYEIPSGYFLAYFLLYMAIFSPLLFLYFLYALIRMIKLNKDRSIIYYISFTSFVFTSILSLRQQILIDSIAPYVIIAIPLMVKVFLHTYRVRLKRYRIRHKLFANLAIAVLLLNYVIIVFNKSWFGFLERPQSHFAYQHYVAKELSHTLKFIGITNIHTNDKELQLRLRFYGIEDSDTIILGENRDSKEDKNIQIVYYGNTIASYFVSKINK